MRQLFGAELHLRRSTRSKAQIILRSEGGQIHLLWGRPERYGLALPYLHRFPLDAVAARLRARSELHRYAFYAGHNHRISAGKPRQIEPVGRRWGEAGNDGGQRERSIEISGLN